MRAVRHATARLGVPLVGALLLGLPGAPALATPSIAASAHTSVSDAPALSVLRDARTPLAREAAGVSPGLRDGRVRLGVELRTGADPAAVQRAAAGRGAGPAHRLDRLRYLSVTVPTSAAAAVSAALSRRADVRAVAAVPTRSPSYVPDDTYWGNQQAYLSAVAAPALWDVTRGSASVKVAVIDTGVDVAHPDLVGKVVAVRNTVAGAASTSDVSDAVGHGTHVAGIAAAASDNGLGVVGAGFDTSVMAVKAGESGFWDDDLASGILWATDNGARVINMSLGGASTSTVLTDAVAYAQAQGVLVVAAAGNESTDVKSYPAALPGVLAVGATNGAGARASFSNFGSWVAVAAPGTGILSTVPTAGSEMSPAPSSGFAFAQGTSMASPVVAGQAALLMGAVPGATGAQVRQAIVSSAHGYAGLGLGAGQVDFAAALTKLPPTSSPAVTSPPSPPTSPATVSGATPLAATSDAPSVRFLVDGTPLGVLVPVVDGTAGTTWETWALANGTHTVAALACNPAGCGPPSTPVPVTVDNPAVAVTSPAPGAAVSGKVSIEVAAPGGLPAVRLVVDGTQVGSPVPVVSGAATLSWDSAGYGNGTRSLGVAPCTSTGICGAPTTVAVSLANTAPALIAPAANQLVSGPFTLAATSASGGIRFLLDGKPLGFDATAPYALAHNFSLVPDGTHTLTLQPCSSNQSTCAGPVRSVTVTVKSLHPVITSVAAAVLSPNGDGRADRAVATYYLPDTQTVSWYVRNAAGAIIRGPVQAGTLTAGTRQLVWDGRTGSGARALDGTYTLTLATRRTSGSTTLHGAASRYVRVDTVAPALSVAAVTAGFYPVTDGYKDTIVPRATVNEAGLLTMTVRNSSGTVVRVLTAKPTAPGTSSLTWNGRNAAGNLLAAGTYRYVVVAQDAALNRRASATYSVQTSWKKLVSTAVTRTVTPAATKTALLVGSCSRVVADPVWTGGYDYESGYHYFESGGTCPDPSDPDLDLAGSQHQLVLPAAVKYTGLSVVATGSRELPQYADEAYGWYRDRYGSAVGGVTLGSEFGSYSLGALSPSALYNGNTVRWTVATDSGQYYAMKSFTVRYTYYVLK